jgi:hypothetical protein
VFFSGMGGVVVAGFKDLKVLKVGRKKEETNTARSFSKLGGDGVSLGRP